jgi:phosphatidylserine/phosphatidylglycerophosphate/cardiolipin synthase-like enzyme
MEDKIGKQYKAALIDAAKRGVLVRLSIDDVGSNELSGDTIAEFTSVGIRM